MKRKTIIIVTIAVVVIAAGLYFIFHKSSGQYQFVTVTQGSITETVSVTGNTTPVQSLDLGFQNGGTIAAVNDPAGAHVNAGDVIARLDTSGLRAQLAQAQASVDAQSADLASLKAGAQPADIEASQAAADEAVQNLANMYSSVATTLMSGFANADDAVRNQLAPFFTNAETSNPQLTFSINNSQTLNNIQIERLQASTELNAWQGEIAMLTASSSNTTLDTALQNSVTHLAVISQLLTTASEALIDATSLPVSTLNTYKADLTSAVTEETSASSAINTLEQNIASQKITVQQLQAELALKVAGSTPEQIAEQQAEVEQAQANVQNIQVSIAEASLSSPIAGVITVQNAKVGEIAAPGATLVSIISDNGFEVDTDVPETDIGKIAVGNPVSMTFDAFPNETFTGKVFYIDPAQTIISGVVDYLVKVSFDTPDPRIKSGLTANLTIETQTDTNALILPQFAIIQNVSGTFVDILQNGAETQVPVMLGIQDQSGNVEIASGVTAGEQVINIGLKP